MADEVLTAPLVLEYPFTRTTGPVIGGFLTGLREGVIHGVRRSDGTVMCPPLEYDPITAAPLSELVAVGTVGGSVAAVSTVLPSAGGAIGTRGVTRTRVRLVTISLRIY